MPDLKQITIPDGTTYDLRDSRCVAATSSSLGLVQPDNSTITINANGVISASGGGSASYTTTTATLTVAGWSNNTQTVSVSSVTATSDIIIAAAPANISAYAAAGIYCSAQAAGSLTFSCSTAPTSAITVNLMIFEGGINIITFTINGHEYNAVLGMTWAEWCNSSYNTAGYYVDSDKIKYGDGSYEIVGATPADVIVDGAVYIAGGGSN